MTAVAQATPVSPSHAGGLVDAAPSEVQRTLVARALATPPTSLETLFRPIELTPEERVFSRERPVTSELSVDNKSIFASSLGAFKAVTARAVGLVNSSPVPSISPVQHVYFDRMFMARVSTPVESRDLNDDIRPLPTAEAPLELADVVAGSQPLTVAAAQRRAGFAPLLAGFGRGSSSSPAAATLTLSDTPAGGDDVGTAITSTNLQPTAVPLPAGFLLLAGGLGAFGVARRIARRAQAEI
ncbi:VPLPA-CTERM sorting domain-containing protein [Gymnodinialimonas sp. 2305UL16-5]